MSVIMEINSQLVTIRVALSHCFLFVAAAPFPSQDCPRPPNGESNPFCFTWPFTFRVIKTSVNTVLFVTCDILLQLVELKNGETYNGHLVNCDTWMNIHLREVICTSKVFFFSQLSFLSFSVIGFSFVYVVAPYNFSLELVT